MPGVVGDSELAESNSITICLGPISCHRQALALHRKSSDSRFAIDANNSPQSIFFDLKENFEFGPEQMIDLPKNKAFDMDEIQMMNHDPIKKYSLDNDHWSNIVNKSLPSAPIDDLILINRQNFNVPKKNDNFLYEVANSLDSSSLKLLRTAEKIENIFHKKIEKLDSFRSAEFNVDSFSGFSTIFASLAESFIDDYPKTLQYHNIDISNNLNIDIFHWTINVLQSFSASLDHANICLPLNCSAKSIEHLSNILSYQGNSWNSIQLINSALLNSFHDLTRGSDQDITSKFAKLNGNYHKFISSHILLPNKFHYHKNNKNLTVDLSRDTKVLNLENDLNIEEFSSKSFSNSISLFGNLMLDRSIDSVRGFNFLSDYLHSLNTSTLYPTEHFKDYLTHLNPNLSSNIHMTMSNTLIPGFTKQNIDSSSEEEINAGLTLLHSDRGFTSFIKQLCKNVRRYSKNIYSNGWNELEYGEVIECVEKLSVYAKDEDF